MLLVSSGVYFRDTTKRKANELSLTGAAYNLKNKKVEIVAEGERGNIEKLIKFCRKGPEAEVEVGISSRLRTSGVDDVHVEWIECSGAREFETFVNGGKK